MRVVCLIGADTIRVTSQPVQQRKYRIFSDRGAPDRRLRETRRNLIPSAGAALHACTRIRSFLDRRSQNLSCVHMASLKRHKKSASERLYSGVSSCPIRHLRRSPLIPEPLPGQEPIRASTTGGTRALPGRLSARQIRRAGRRPNIPTRRT